MHPLLKSYFNFIKKMIPDQSEGKSIGVDISSTECRMVELSKKGNDVVVSNWHVEPVINEDIQEAIKKTLIKASSTEPCTHISTTVCGKGTLTRYIDLPRMSSADLKNSFALEADKYFPFPQDQIYTDCYITNLDEKSSKMSVMAVAARKEIVDKKIALLDSVGLKTNLISTNSIVLMNTMATLGYPLEVDGQSAFAILDVGDTVSNVSIIMEKTPRFTRDIFIGTKDFIKKIGNSLNVGPLEATNLLENPKDKLQEIVSVCESSIQNIIQELMLSFDYFSTEKNVEISSIVITGEGRCSPIIYGMLNKSLDIKNVEWDPVSLIEVMPEIDSDSLKKKSAKMAVAIGLALYDYD